MRIKRLRLTGFKSFVEPADLRIEPGLTGVVGPNGCGKSNLLEALRWTMGENSPRSMRGAGMEDVIFAGTATRPPRNFAEVSLLAELPNADGGMDEAEVVRRIERGTGSAYRIDGRDVRAKDVQLLFADAATGAHSPALVSQNRISAVIAARPAERRAMLEEAAGIAGLHVRRKDAETRLRATEANLARLDEVIADADARAAALRRQARQAERYRALSAQIRTAEARMVFARWRDAAVAAKAARAEAVQAEALVARATASHADAQAAQATATATLAAARADALAARDRSADSGHRVTAIRAQKLAAERRLDELVVARTRIQADRAREGTLAVDAADALARLASEMAQLGDALARAAQERGLLDAALAEAERHAGDAEIALAQAQARQAAELADARVARAARATAQARLDRATREAGAAEAALAALPQEAPLAAARDTARADQATARTQSNEAGSTVADAERAEAAARGVRDAAQARRAGVRAELAALDGELGALERADRAAPGRGVLAQISVSPGYERALAAALGDDLGAGLDPGTDRHWGGADRAPDDPAPADTLADHVNAPMQLARRLAQVIVVPLDDGRALAPGQRLVTTGGTMRRWDGFVATGNGAAAAERLVRANRLALLREQRPALASAADVAEAELAAASDAIATARFAADAGRRALAAADAALRDARQRDDRATAALERLDAQRHDLARRNALVAAERAEAEADRSAAHITMQALPDPAATLAVVADLQRDAAARRSAAAQARADRAALERSAAADAARRTAAQEEVRGWRARAGDAARRLADMERREAEIAAESTTLAARPATLAADLGAATSAHEAARAEADRHAGLERSADTAQRTTETNAHAAAEALAAAREARAAAVTRLEAQELRRVEMGRVSGERFECPAPVLPERIGFDPATVGTLADESRTHERLSADRERIGPVNLVAEQELAALDAERGTSAVERDELGQAVSRLRGSIGTLNREGRERLRAAFEAVDGHFRRLFATLFDGGQAHLAMIDSDDPLEAGLEIMAQPPGKRLQSLTLLSGGEQALTAVALIFGLFLTNPAPICVLDEVDAPLDDANIERFCGLLDRMARETDTRYLIVTHNAVTMSRMHRLFGVTMIEQGVSRLVSVDLGGATALVDGTG